MSSPSTNVRMVILNNMASNPKPTVADFKIVYVGKDKYHICILEMDLIYNDGWKKCLFETFHPRLKGTLKCRTQGI